MTARPADSPEPRLGHERARSVPARPSKQASELNIESSDPHTSEGGVGSDPAPRPIVAGIGASAGGLEALKALFEALPGRPGIAFVVIVHLSADHESVLGSILARHTSLVVDTVTERVLLEADHVYVIPPGQRLEVTDGHIEAVPFAGTSLARAPIDAFFRSLAAQHGDGFAIILSGGGSDGAAGVGHAREAGALVIVQDPAEAISDSMPRAAIASGAADLVLPIAEIGARLGVLTEAKRRGRERLARVLGERLSPDDEAELGRILAYVFARTGHDFSRYKRATVLRRVFRRMQLARVHTLRDYAETLRADAAEPHALFDDLLITVTAFFRDTDSWQTLEKEVVPAVYAAREPSEPVRVWVAGCATGEEAYSLVMLLIEEAERCERWPEVQVFATDLDEAALGVAREGCLLDYLGTAFPNRNFLITEDAPAANGPHLEALAAHDMDFIIGVKPGNSSVFETEIMRRHAAGELVEWQDTMADDGSVCGYRYTLGVPINATYKELLVNYLEWWEVDKQGRQKVFTWVTNLTVTTENAFELARAARARWRVENEVFNVLKNQGYEFGRNYGHGKKYLSSTLAALTMLAFLVDQIRRTGVPCVQGGESTAAHEEVVVGEDESGHGALSHSGLGNDDGADDRSGRGESETRTTHGLSTGETRSPSAHSTRKTHARSPQARPDRSTVRRGAVARVRLLRYAREV